MLLPRPHTPHRLRASLALVVLACLASCGPGEDASPSHTPATGSAAGTVRLDPGLEARILRGDDADLLVERPASLPRLPQGELLFDPKVQTNMEPDPVSYVRRPAHAKYRVASIKSYPGGTYWVTTNGLGLREDEEVRGDRPALRVLVAGDSHTDGVVENRFSFSNVLEARLAEGGPDRAPIDADVLNAGVGGTTFPHYLGTLVKFLPLEPDVFVIGVYGGNDFLPLTTLARQLFGQPAPSPPAGYWRRVMGAKDAVGGGIGGDAATAQIYNQRWRLAQVPGEFERSRQLALTWMASIQKLCSEREIRLVVLYLPSADEVEPERWRHLTESLDAHFEFDERERRLAHDLVDGFLGDLRAAGFEVLDAREALRRAAEAAPQGEGDEEPLFWVEDLHLALRGHRVVADALYEFLR